MPKKATASTQPELRDIGTVQVLVRRFGGHVIAEFNSSGTAGADVKFGLDQDFKTGKDCIVALAQHLKANNMTGILKIHYDKTVKA